MRRPVRKTRFDGAVLAGCLFLAGQAWVKPDLGDHAGAAGDLAAAGKLLPPGSIEAIRNPIVAGFLPEPGPGPEAMDAWLEACRMAGAGEWTLTRYVFPSAAEPAQEEHEAFLARLGEIGASARRRMASGELKDRPPPPEKPVRPPPKSAEFGEPGALSGSLRRMGLM